MTNSLNTPSVLTQPIAENGDKNTIPATNEPSSGNMSQSLGFPPICSTRIADGGKAPSRKDMNGALNLTSRHHYFLQNGGTETFRQEVSDAIGGYPKDARLWYKDSNGNTLILRSLIGNNTYNFNTNSAYVDDGVHWTADVPTKSYVQNYFDSRMQDVNALPSNPDSNVFYFVKG